MSAPLPECLCTEIDPSDVPCLTGEVMEARLASGDVTAEEFAEYHEQGRGEIDDA